MVSFIFWGLEFLNFLEIFLGLAVTLKLLGIHVIFLKLAFKFCYSGTGATFRVGLLWLHYRYSTFLRTQSTPSILRNISTLAGGNTNYC